MANVLEKIVADKKAELERLQLELPLESFKDTLTPSKKSLFSALSKENAGFIFECKKASPSKGLIRENFDLDEIVSAYEKSAAAISVLTDEKYFQGKFEYLDFVTSRVDIPVLNKDFFVSEYQVYRARYHNADAILLMLSVLSDEEYKKLHRHADLLSLDVLTEVSNEEETERALALGAKIIGINNRNLRDLSTDLATTEKLVPIIREHPDFSGVIISESGIYTHSDIRRLNHIVDGYLVGSSLMSMEDLDLAIAQLIYGKVKVCGITSVEQSDLVSQFPVSYQGLIFVPSSKRFVSTESAIDIVNANQRTQYVGVFQDQPLTQLAEIANKLQLSAIQLHGHEDQSYVDNLRMLLPPSCQLWKTIAVDLHDDSKDLSTPHMNNIDYYLFDSMNKSQRGGTGMTFDWSKLKNKMNKPFILAGGISPDNAQSAFDTGAEMIDVNSGVESQASIKSEQKLKALFNNLKA